METPPGVERSVSLPGEDRLDKELCQALRISREAAKRMIVTGRVRIAGATRHHPARRLGRPTEVEILSKPSSPAPAPAPVPSHVPGDVRVIYEDDTILALNKPAGLAVHPGAGHEHDTLMDWLREKKFRMAAASHGADPARAGLVHRLDKDTSGLILLAKDSSVAEKLMVQFAKREVDKVYLAVVQGKVPKRPLKIVGAIGRNPVDRKKFGIQRGGREAVTMVECIAQSAVTNASFVRVIPKTGRTHQIRVHMKHVGFPILGDPLYGVRGVFGIRRMLLHAYLLEFAHPVLGRRLRITAGLPTEFEDALKQLGFTDWVRPPA